MVLEGFSGDCPRSVFDGFGLGCDHVFLFTFSPPTPPTMNMIVSNMARAGVIGAIALAIFSGTVDIRYYASCR